MPNIEYFYPEVKIIIGTQAFSKGISLQMVSSKKKVYDYAKITFTPILLDKINVKKDMTSEIWFGYSSKLEKIFTGTVWKEPAESEDKTCVQLRDNMSKLNSIIISDTYVAASPQDIIKDVLLKAGISNYILDTTNYPTKTLSIHSMNGIKAIELVNTYWKLDHQPYMLLDTFAWGQSPKQSEIALFEYGSNILNLTKTNGQWQLETASVPFLKHSTKIRVQHPLINGDFELNKILFAVNDQGFVRSTLYF